MLWRGRLPGAISFGCPGSRENSAARLCKMIPVSPATMPEPKTSEMLVMNETALRSLSTTVK